MECDHLDENTNAIQLAGPYDVIRVATPHMGIPHWGMPTGKV